MPTIQTIVASRAVVLDSQGRLLLVSDAGEFWYLPGGYQETNETLMATAERETYEETGLVVEAVGLLFASEYVDHERFDPNFDLVHKIEHYVLCRIVQGTLQEDWHDFDDDLVQHRRFVSQQELQQNSFALKPEFLRRIPLESLQNYANTYMEFEHRVPQDIEILKHYRPPVSTPEKF